MIVTIRPFAGLFFIDFSWHGEEVTAVSTTEAEVLDFCRRANALVQYVTGAPVS